MTKATIKGYLVSQERRLIPRTQSDISKELGISIYMVRKIERSDTIELEKEIVDKLCHILRCSLKYLNG